MLCNHKGLAKTSATPGKTLLINHFIINDSWYLVDLPGYGFAKRSKTVQQKLQQMISSYILQREQLVNLFVLIDIRHEQQKIDREFIDWLGESGVPFTIVFTKADKLGVVKSRQNAEKWMKQLADTWEELPPYFVTSSEKRIGREELLNYIDEINKKIEAE
jgi:ribosome biogenesis GTP-binding protein ysxC